MKEHEALIKDLWDDYDTALGVAKVAALAALGFSYKPSPSAVPADSDDDSGDGADDSDGGEAGDKTKEDVVTDFSDLFESFDFARL